jgi:hypothetical protein
MFIQNWLIKLQEKKKYKIVDIQENSTETINKIHQILSRDFSVTFLF